MGEVWARGLGPAANEFGPDGDSARDGRAGKHAATRMQIEAGRKNAVLLPQLQRYTIVRTPRVLR